MATGVTHRYHTCSADLEDISLHGSDTYNFNSFFFVFPHPYLYTSSSKVRALAPNTFIQSYLLHKIVLELQCITAKQLEKRTQGWFEIATFPF